MEQSDSHSGLKRVHTFLTDCCFSCCKKSREVDERTKLLTEDSTKVTEPLASRIFADKTESDNDKELDTSETAAGSSKEETTVLSTTAQVEPLLVDLSEDSVTEPKKLELPKTKQAKKKPNYFVGIQISNPEILSGLKLVQDAVLKTEPRFEALLEPLAKAHITLAVFHVDDDNKLEKAKEALDICCRDLTEEYIQNPLEIEISKISSFNGKVLFAGIEGSSRDRVASMAEKVVEVFESFEFDARENRPYNPHLTLFKFKFPLPKKYNGPKKIPSSAYEKFAESSFGSQRIDSIQLLSMDEEKDENGYYICIKEDSFLSPQPSEL